MVGNPGRRLTARMPNVRGLSQRKDTGARLDYESRERIRRAPSNGDFPMIERWLEILGVGGRCGLVVAASGASDGVLAHALAAEALRLGARRMDLVEPIGTDTLRVPELEATPREAWGLVPVAPFGEDQVLRLARRIANPDGPIQVRSKGLRVAAALEWTAGERLVAAGTGAGLRGLATRCDADGAPLYDFALVVDGGGDILIHGDTEYDRRVLAHFVAAWPRSRPLGLFVLGLGIDGGPSPEALVGAAVPGFRLLASAEMGPRWAEAFERALSEANCWHPAPDTWTLADPAWAHGLKVPQILAMAIRREFPFPSADEGRVTFPRRKHLIPMSPALLREAQLHGRLSDDTSGSAALGPMCAVDLGR